MADHLTPAQSGVTNRRAGAGRRSPHRMQWQFGPVTPAAMRTCGGAIYIVAHKAKMVDRRDGGPPCDP